MTTHAETTQEGTARPLFTIAIPTFNRARLLRDAVTSALSQTFSSFEVVVSDNASTDDTPALLAQFADDRLSVIRQRTNIGPINNWNACLNAANGTYVVMLSDDDTLAEHFLERCSSVLGNGVDVPLVVALGDVLDAETGQMRPALTSSRLESGVHDGTEILREFLRGSISPQMCTVAVKTQTLRGEGGFPDGWPHTGDLVSWVPLLLRGKSGLVNESCGTHRSHVEAQSTQLSLDSRLTDIERLAGVIDEETERRVHDPVVAAELRGLVRRYVARNLLGHLAGTRRMGASRRSVASAAWSRRHRLFRRGSLDLGSLGRPLAVFVAPVRLMPPISRAKRRLAGIRESKRNGGGRS